MKVLITGAAGMIGRKVLARLAKRRMLSGHAIESVLLHDVVSTSTDEAPPFRTEIFTSDISVPADAQKLIGRRPDVIFHLAAIVSGDAEADFEKGYRINLDGTRLLFEAIRKTGAGYRPRVVFASSIAVFGAPFPEAIDDEFLAAPLTSYGTQKAICELLLSDYSRRGFLDGVGIRLPTICVRPGRPNKAASGFFSAIIREPLQGREAILPVADGVRHWHASPRAAVEFLLHAAELETVRLGDRRNLSMPGVSVTVAEQIAALRRVAGDGVTKLIRRAADPAIAAIVSGWPQSFNPERAVALGFRADTSFDEIIRVHIEDELGGNIGSSRTHTSDARAR